MGRRRNCPDCGKICNGERCRKCATDYHYDNQDYKEDDRRRNSYLKWKYGWSVEEFEAYWFANHGRCYICRALMRRPTKGQGQALDIVAVDHCHSTGTVRGLLCNRCNKGLGFFKDNVEILKKAIRYLENGH